MSLEAHELRLVTFRITSDCVGCGQCRRKCPWEAIIGAKKQKHVIEPTVCQGCGTCWNVCPKRAVEDAHGLRREGKGRGKLPKARIESASCAGCKNCLLNCEQAAISYQRRLLAGHCQVDENRCAGCGSCLVFCASDCISFE
jgi:MinD superfamily P-loop ATPase